MSFERKSLRVGWLLVSVCVGLAGSMAQAHAAPPQTIPALREWVPASGYYRLGSETRISAPHELGELAATLADEIRSQTGYAPAVIESDGGAASSAHGDILLRLGENDPQLGADGYRLSVSGDVEISGATSAGVFYGTRSLLQLLRERLRLPAGTARDWPDYSERALMFDVGRKFFEPAFIERHIRELAYLKGNYFHLHLSDVDALGGYGFRLQSALHPELTSELHYTKGDIEAILDVARRYHVLVVPEIDVPAHAKALIAPHPELALAGSEDKLDLSQPGVYALLGDLLDEYLPWFDAPYWHGGGDEYLLPEQYAEHPELLAAARERYGSEANAEDLYIGLINWLDERVRSHGKTLRAWSDIYGVSGNVNTPNADIVLELWREAISPEDALAKGHRISNSQSARLYYVLGYDGFLSADPVNLYEEWQPNRQWLKDIDIAAMPPVLTWGPDLEPRTPGLLGAKFHVWCDYPDEQTPNEVQDNIFTYLRSFAQNTWGSDKPAADYGTFYDLSDQLGREPLFGPHFTLFPEAYERELSPGETAEFTLDVLPELGFSGRVALSCTSAPAARGCSVSPGSVTLDGASPVPVRVSFGAGATASPNPPGNVRGLPPSVPIVACWLGVLGVLGAFLRHAARRPSNGRPRARAALTCVFAGTLFGIPASCGPGPSAELEPGDYTLRVRAVSGEAFRVLELYAKVE